MLFSDADIRKAVANSIQWDSRIESGDINVDVRNGNVTLSGTVLFLTSRKYAEDNAYLVPGVLHVTNDISVLAAREAPPDDTIRNNIKNVLFWNPSIDAARIDIMLPEAL